MPEPRRVAEPRWSTSRWFGDGPRVDVRANAKGVLVVPNGAPIRGWGDPRVRRYVALLFAWMQYEFVNGRMAAVCEHIDPSSDIPFDGITSDAPCPRQLHALTRRLERSGFKGRPLRFLWVRAYPGVAGIWVEDAKGLRRRVPFVQRGRGGWLLELRHLQPEMLAMPLRWQRQGR
jgi:hypothetical protein